jgi:toxin HigB-1
VIASFADETTKDVFNGENSQAARRIPKELWRIAARKLEWVNAAKEVRDLASPPGNRLERLKGDRHGFYSVRINDQYRIVFLFENGSASKVQIVD